MKKILLISLLLFSIIATSQRTRRFNETIILNSTPSTATADSLLVKTGNKEIKAIEFFDFKNLLNLNFLTNVVEDLSPQLGGNLDLNGSDITGIGNFNNTGSITTSGTLQSLNAIITNDVTFSNYPNVRVDATAVNFLHTDVSGNLQSSPISTLGNVFKVGIPLDNQVGVWTGDGTIEGDPLFNWNGVGLDIGADDTTIGLLELRGGAGGNGGEIRIYAGATQDLNDEHYIINAQSNQLTMGGVTTGLFFSYNSTNELIRWQDYGLGNRTGTATFMLAVDTNGQMIEEALPSSPTTIVGITGTKAQYNTSLTDGTFAFPGIDNGFVGQNITGNSSVIGDFGIGTSGPLAKFEIRDADATAFLASDAEGQRTAGTTALIFNTDATTESFSQLVFRNRTSGIAIGRIAYITKGSGQGDMAFVTENGGVPAERLRIKADGDIIVPGTINGIGVVEIISKTSDQSRTSTTTSTIDDTLSVSVDATSNYIFECYVRVTAVSSTPDIKVRVYSTVGGVIDLTTDSMIVDIGGVAPTPTTERSMNSAIAFDLTTAANVILLRGSFTTITSGTVGLLWAQNTSSGDATTVKENSYFKIQKVN